MPKQSKAIQIWNIFYPIAIYFVITTIALFVLDFLIPETTETKLFRQLLTSFAALPFLYSFYRQDEILRGNQTAERQIRLPKIQFARFLGIFLIGGCFAVALNNLLGMIRITDYSASYSQVTETFYTGKILLETAALCIVIPTVEEILYRGIVYGRLRDWFGFYPAVILSAVIFGLIHMNLVQFIYASVFGLLLACVTEACKNLSGAIAAHIAANLTSVLRAETKIFAFMDKSLPVQIAVTIVLFAISALGIFLIWKQADPKINDRLKEPLSP